MMLLQSAYFGYQSTRLFHELQHQLGDESHLRSTCSCWLFSNTVISNQLSILWAYEIHRYEIEILLCADLYCFCKRPEFS